jgi:DNA adenine methylase
MSDLLAQLMSLDDTPEVRDQYLRAPFPYPGSKTRSLEHLLSILPYRRAYIEPCGGSGAVMLARRPSKLEVFNDRFSGVVAFFRCLRDPIKNNLLVDRLELTIHSREEFIWSRDTWDHNELDDVERAARWYYALYNSFNKKGWQFGRATKTAATFGSAMKNNLKNFKPLMYRTKNIQFENQDWRAIIKDYNRTDDEVWYFDPPYLNSTGMYKHNWLKEDHVELCERIQSMHGYIALSGYDWDDHPYNRYKWDDKKVWEIDVKATGLAFTDTNNLESMEHSITRGKVKETLWIRK